MIENLTDLKYFLEVARTGNITRAAEALAITQPSLTVALQRLEEKSGFLLLDRSRAGVTLTRQGLALKISGERMLEHWERELRTIGQGLEQPAGRYRFGVHTAVAQYTLGSLIPHLLESFTELELSFQHDHSKKICERIIERECDLGLVINPLPHPDLVLLKLLTDEVTLFKHPAYRGDVLILDPELRQSQTLITGIRKAFPFKREIHSSSLEVIRDLAEARAGAAILPSRVAAKASKLGPVKGASSFRDELCLTFRVERKRERSFQLLVQEIRKRLTTE